MRANAASLALILAALVMCSCASVEPSQQDIDKMTADEALEAYHAQHMFETAESKAALRRRLRAQMLKTSPEAQDWNWPTRVKIADGRIDLGMTKRMVQFALGYPSDINRTVTNWGTEEQWVYGWSKLVYFENGVVTAIQD